MTAHTLNENFGLPGILHFAEDAAHGELLCAEITLPACTAKVFLHGAHLAAWQPTGMQTALFLSSRSEFFPGKAIRGGIPVCFPWFGPRSFTPDGLPQTVPGGPSHGFARLQAWDVAFAALVPGGGSDELHLTLTLGPSDVSRSFGYGSFRVAYEMVFGAEQGRRLTLRLTVANAGHEPMAFEEALHTYFAVSDVAKVTLSGLKDATYLDKTDGMSRKQASPNPLRLTGQTDRVFPGNSANTAIHDPDGHRSITIAKQHSSTTVVWNPWSDGAATLGDLAPDAWPEFLCVEAVNAGADRVMLAPGETHTMEASILLEAIPS
jgi:glucose-6-phosphate 1-epimerase